ncbi:O-antigen polymerase [Vibrio cyclitrophicus]|uniref:O-antigen polymerase n=1 Tax=Vibrio cyclitrophicus TaxID=47951 RepID=UPI00029AE9AB|nr:O-antigen polymerase [Vibrio cyclitrophicus]OEE21942.1 hypothetical protein OAM_22250 [Vibrio cyclitrophicus ZF14]
MAYFIITITSVLFVFYIYKLRSSGNLVFILPLYYSFTVLYVLIGLYIFNYAKEVPFDIYSLVYDEYVINSAKLYVLSSFSFCLGAMFFSRNGNVRAKNNSVQADFKYQKLLLLLSVSIFVLYVFSYGIEPLIYRVGYISSEHERNKYGSIVFYLTSPFIFVLMPFIKRKFLRILFFVVFFLALFSSSSRFLVMLPFLYLVGVYIKNRKLPLTILFLHLSMIAGGLMFVLQIRYYQYHGLIPNIASFFSKGIDYDYIFVGLNYAFSFSLMGTAYVLKGFTFDINSFFISINPLPSMFVDIEYMLSTQQMLPTAPISAISLLSLSGYLGLVVFYITTGCFFSYSLSKFKGQNIVYYIILGLFVMFTLFSIQYNLRGLTRFLYYSILLHVFYLAWIQFVKFFKKESR